MRTRIHLWGKVMLLVGGIAVLGFHAFGQAYGKSHDEVCTVANIAGAYGAYGSGTFLPGNFVGVPPGLFATIARVELDGQGGFLVTSQTASFNGTIVRNITGQGTLTVNPDCTGQIAVGADTADVVFVDNRTEFYATDTTAGLSTTFVFKRITTEK
jgi:hypothetical protein